MLYQWSWIREDTVDNYKDVGYFRQTPCIVIVRLELIEAWYTSAFSSGKGRLTQSSETWNRLTIVYPKLMRYHTVACYFVRTPHRLDKLANEKDVLPPTVQIWAVRIALLKKENLALAWKHTRQYSPPDCVGWCKDRFDNRVVKENAEAPTRDRTTDLSLTKRVLYHWAIGADILP